MNEASLSERVRTAVGETVVRQAEVGVDVVNDGEVGKPGYTVYVKARVTRLRILDGTGSRPSDVEG